MSAFVPSEWEVNGWRVRLDQGRKAPEDVRIWVASPGGDYSLLSLASLGVITRLWFDNEQRLYQPPAKGGYYVLEFLQACCETDLRSACVAYRLREPYIRRLDEERVAA